jgi:tRNA pseudouridine55 synthase
VLRWQRPGFLLIDKQCGPTSHDVVASVKGILGIDKAGHTGTLDPLASGILVVLTGRATKLASYIQGDPKIYEGCILLGLTTDSMDVEGKVTSHNGYKDGPEAVEEALASLVGELEQLPPMYSAVKYRGKPLYRYARMGEHVPRKSRHVQVYSAEMKGFRRSGACAEVDFLVACSPGTYVRELAARIGDMLACGGTISRLRRLASGPFNVADALSLEELKERLLKGYEFPLSLDAALQGYKRVKATEKGIKVVRNGMPIGPDILQEADEGITDGDVVAVFGAGELIGMHLVSSVKPYKSRALRMM